MIRPQLPGRLEALNEVIRQGVDNASPELKRLAGLGKVFPPRPKDTPIQTHSFTSGMEKLSREERDALPF